MDISQVINPKYLSDDAISQLHEQYETAEPFKHLVLENFFTEDVANRLFEHFPSMDSLKVKRKSLNEDKVEDYHFERWDPVFTDARNALSSDE